MANFKERKMYQSQCRWTQGQCCVS